MTKRPRRRESLVGLADCKQVMDLALQNDGLIYELETRGQAINFKQRCYRFRNLMRELEAERLNSDIGVSVAYDVLLIRHVRPEAGEKQSRFLQFDHKKVLGNLHMPDGTQQQLSLPSAPGLFDED